MPRSLKAPTPRPRRPTGRTRTLLLDQNLLVRARKTLGARTETDTVTLARVCEVRAQRGAWVRHVDLPRWRGGHEELVVLERRPPRRTMRSARRDAAHAERLGLPPAGTAPGLARDRTVSAMRA